MSHDEHTETHQATETISESKGRFQVLVNATGNVVYRMSPDWCEMRSLDGAGFVVDMQSPTTDWVEIYIPADEQPRVRDAVERAIRTKAPFELLHRVLQMDGAVGWMQSRAVPLFDDAGEIVEWFGAASDVTARVKADQSFTRLFQASPAPFLVLAPDAPRFTIKEVNDAYLAATMTTRGGIIGRGVFEAFPDNPDDSNNEGVSTLRASLEQVLVTREPHALPGLKYDVARPDGSFEARWWSPVNSPVLDECGEVEAIIHNANDVTDELRAQVELRELNETLESRVADALAERRLLADVIDGTDIFVQVLDHEYNWLAINNAATDEFARIFGVCRPRAGDNMLEMLAQRPDDRAAVEAIWSRALGGEEFVELVEFGDPPFDRLYYEMRFRTLRDAGGRALGAYQFVSNVTERLQEQVRLKEAEEALRQSQKMEAVGQLTGGLAHDFNNLLTGIMGNLELLQNRVAAGRFDSIDRFVNAAQGAGRRAAALTHRLLAFSRRQTLDPKPTNVNRLIAGMEELIRRSVGPAIDIEVVGAAGLWPTLIDAGQLENALLNLAINARDAMPDGGRLTIETANKWLDGRTARARDLPPGQYLSICVTDTGTGMPPDVIARAFDPFYTTKPLGEGTGLGLSMIYGFARQSGGQVRIYSEVGVGTTMCIYLPRHVGDEPENAAGFENNDALGTAKGETILVVEDEPTIRHLIDEVLDEQGYTVIGAADGAAGLKVLQSGARIELLITDVGLPGGMNGRQVADAARSLQPELKVLFITGYAENAAVGNGHLDAGMELLTKPFSLEDLARRVSDLVAKRI
ncbi:MAG: PAS domain-containing protein [Janthinobacterium lividum]